MRFAQWLRAGSRVPHFLAAVAVTGVAAVALPLATLSSSADRASASTTTSGRIAHVVERDFSIAAPKRLPAGELSLIIRNNGPDRHELIIVRAKSSHRPLREDGLTVDEESLQSRAVATLEPAPDGTVRQLRLHLAPGRYVLFCNMAGHYLGGMHATLDVR